ncbi:Zinc finger protein 112 [Eumeta japonica]|uniref:Zinc finger protein 112 n=1 Tax=Eumeta variegata TaxID=151549 RepID=A0A4C1YCS1_EUMVA|nr:Zinc finger protein 112 [Eumeta japonica]
MDASARNIEERPMQLSLCKLTSRGGATRAEGGVPAAPRQSEAVASPHATNFTREYDEMLKMDIKTECDVEDSAIAQVLAMSHSHILESSMAGPSLLVKEEGDFILKTENEVDEMMIKQELDIEPISLQSKITPHLLLPADEQADPDARPNTSFCEGTAPAPLYTVVIRPALHKEVKKHYCDEDLGVPPDVNVMMCRRCPSRTPKAGETTYDCEYYKCTSVIKSNIKSQMCMHNGKKRYKCGQYEYSESEKSGLKLHMRKKAHTGERPCKREKCELSTSDTDRFKVHMRTHTGERPYKCERPFEQCEYNVSSKHASHGERPYCEQFKRIHTGERPFKCEQCEFSASVRSSLRIHKRTHTGERPYKCEQCNFSTPHAGTLKVHMHIHTGERPYKCGQLKRIQPSGSQKRKLKKAKTEEAQSLAGSLSIYLSNFEENKSGVAKEINQAVESGSNIQIIYIETANIGEKSSKCDINNNSDVTDTEIQDYRINKLKKNTKGVEEYVPPELEFLSFNDAAHWPIPVSEHISISIIEKGSEIFQNKDEPFESVERPAQQNLAFRGHCEDISSENRGNFLELVQLLAKYDPVLKEHCLKQEAAGASKRVPPYLSKGIQNEFTQCLGDM